MTDHWRARAVIDLGALEHNLHTVRRLAGQAKIFAVVKADAYGHGIENIVPTALDHVDGFAVATLEEGIRCRSLAPLTPIIVLSEFNASAQLQTFADYSLQPVVHGEYQLPWLQQYRGAALDCWIKVDTGMNRLGVGKTIVTELMQTLNQYGAVNSLGIMSHLASADELESDQSMLQLREFTHLAKQFDGPSSMGNSAAVVRSMTNQFDMVRPGLLLYGASPMSDDAGTVMDLKPVMQLEARLIEVKQIMKGETVGYGGSWTAPRACKIGVACLGYADGYPRAASNRGQVLVNGVYAPVVGKVSMDMTTLDLSDCGAVAPGDIVQFWGPGLAVEKVAAWSDTISYELLCRVSPRVPRVIKNLPNGNHK